jgi:hypothetical protein
MKKDREEYEKSADKLGGKHGIKDYVIRLENFKSSDF